MAQWNLPSRYRWIGMLIFAAIFLILGLGAAVAVFSVADDTGGRFAFGGVALLCLVVGGTALAFAPRARRESGTTSGPLSPVQAASVAQDLERPWPLPAVASALAHELRGTPYRVAHDDRAMEVTWDLGDRSWWVGAQRNGIRRIFSTRLVMAGPGKVTRTDHYFTLDWQAGAPIVGAATGTSSGGRVWRFEKRVELGTDRDGVTVPVDVTFSTNDLDVPLQRVLDAAGWTSPKLGAEAKGALVVGMIGASAVVIVPLVFLVRWLFGL